MDFINYLRENVTLSCHDTVLLNTDSYVCDLSFIWEASMFSLHTYNIDHTYHYLLLLSLISFSLPADLKMLIHIWGISCEATLGSSGHLIDHRVCGRGEQEPVHAVEAGDNSQKIQMQVFNHVSGRHRVAHKTETQLKHSYPTCTDSFYHSSHPLLCLEQ